MIWRVDLIVSFVVAGTSLAIVFLVGRSLINTRRFSDNKLAIATVLILFAVGLGHLFGAAALLGGGPEALLRREATSAPVVAWNVVTALAAIALLALRRQFPQLMRVTVSDEERELRAAIERGEMELEFQPHVDLATREVSGFEALVRWRHPERGLLAPASFVPLAERTGLITKIGEVVLEQACTRAAGWSAPTTPFVAVNLSSEELSDPLLADRVTHALEVSGLDPARLVVEVTETGVVESAATGAQALAMLRRMGVRVALDDFGTGYSALAKLAALPIDVIKIARPFVVDLQRPGTQAIVASLVELASKLGMTTVVEGVETAEQLVVLERLGCESAQGYLFGRPMGSAAVDDLLALRSAELAGSSPAGN